MNLMFMKFEELLIERVVFINRVIKFLDGNGSKIGWICEKM